MERIQKHINKSADKVREKPAYICFSLAYVHLLTQAFPCAPPHRFLTLCRCAVWALLLPSSLFHRSGVGWYFGTSVVKAKRTEMLSLALWALILFFYRDVIWCDMSTKPQADELLHVDTPVKSPLDQALKITLDLGSLDHFQSEPPTSFFLVRDIR